MIFALSELAARVGGEVSGDGAARIGRVAALEDALLALQSWRASSLRLLFFALPVIWMATQPWFTMRHVWYLSLASVFAHVCVLVWLVQRQFAARLK